MDNPSKKIITLILLVLNFFCCCKVFAQNQTVSSWGYKGNLAPERWSQLDPTFELCAKGKQQSPIDIPEQVTKLKIPLKLDYHVTPFSIINTGHTIQVNFPPTAMETLIFNEQTFRLLAIHVHAPSEHLWHGRDFPLEIHLIHENSNGKLLFMAIFGKGGDENPELAKIIASMPRELGKTQPVSLLRLNPEALLPESREYYAFMGSLTIPPCTEGVQWIVFANPMSVSPAQIMRFKQAFGGVNARPTQPLNNRQIFHSTQRKKANHISL